MGGVNSWKGCFSGELHLVFEPSLPSTRSYKRWLVENLTKRQFIPYVLDSACQKQNLEGATNADALLLNLENGFATVIEAKVLSDASCQIVYDTMRNQISRNIDVMLERDEDLSSPLDKGIRTRRYFCWSRQNTLRTTRKVGSMVINSTSIKVIQLLSPGTAAQA